jgi:1,4-dihydroxy-2-naphthoate polyprenyltransferase
MELVTKIKVYIRAFRLPFLAASILPFIFGSLYPDQFNFSVFIGGLIAVVATHLGANLINDYADSKSGVDWQDKKFYGFFGGSKLIQEGALAEKFYAVAAIFSFFVALLAVLFLVYYLGNFLVLIYYLLILFLGFSYSHKPFCFSYHYLGEFIIFLLFGLATVMGGYYLQTGIFPSFKSFFLALPFGFFTVLILISNEIPDYREDRAARKRNLVQLFNQKYAYFLYLLIAFFGFLAIFLACVLGFLSFFAIISLGLIYLIVKAAIILKNDYDSKTKLIKSSKLTILNQTWVGVILIFSLLFK